MNIEEIDKYVTKRLLEFYDGLRERGQIPPPASPPAEETPLSDYTADQYSVPSPPRSEGGNLR